MAQQTSALQQYVSNYGSRLQSLLNSGAVTDTTSVLGRPSTPQPPPPASSQLSTPIPQQQEIPEQHRSMLEEQQEGGTSVRSAYKSMSDEDQKKQAADLEDALSRGGTNIDQAYDELVKQMGTRPDEDLSKEEKAMLIIEFGLNLMANSSSRAYGDDLGGALGATGLNTMDSYQRTKGARARNYDRQRSALEAGRVKDKAAMSEFAAKEEIKEDAKLPEEFAPVKPDRDNIITEDGSYFSVTDGVPAPLVGPDGNVLKAPAKDVVGSDATRPTAYQTQLESFMQANGYDWEGNPVQPGLEPLEGPDLLKLRQRAIAAARDAGGEFLSDTEIRREAERLVDAHIRNVIDFQYRDFTPQQMEAEREKLVEQRVRRMKMERDGPPERGPAKGPQSRGSIRSGVVSSSQQSALEEAGSPPVEALVAGKARKIRGYEGRWTLVDGKPVRVD
jgi:hypothetical protein